MATANLKDLETAAKEFSTKSRVLRNIKESLDAEIDEVKAKYIEELKKETTDDGIEGNINILIDDIIYYIYKKNNILYNEKIKWDKRLKVLKDINIISNEILDMIMLLGKESKANTSKVGESENSKMRILYEVLVWFVVNYGEENYSLILDNLISPQKEIFVKYLSGNKEKIIKGEIENKNGELEGKDDIIRQLVEKGENYYFGRGVKRDNNKAYRYFLDAAKYKNEYAEAYLGLFYEKGIAVRKNYEIAYQWYYKAAVKGNAFAQYSLGVLYSEGNGVNKDYNKVTEEEINTIVSIRINRDDKELKCGLADGTMRSFYLFDSSYSTKDLSCFRGLQYIDVDTTLKLADIKSLKNLKGGRYNRRGGYKAQHKAFKSL